MAAPFGPNDPDGPDDPDDIAHLFEGLPFDVHEVAKEELRDRMAANDWQLSRADADQIGAMVGRSWRQVYRWADDIRPKQRPRSTWPEEWTFLDKLAVGGATALEIDWLFVVLYYICDGNMRRLKEEVENLGLPMPSEATLSRRINDPEVAPLLKDGARYGLKHRYTKALFIRRNDHRYSDEVWSIDEFVLRIEVLIPHGTVTKCRPHLLLIIDWESGLIRAWGVFPRSVNRFDVCALMGDAAERWADLETGQMLGGPCEFITADNGTIFRNGEVADGLRSIPSQVRFSPVYTPTANARAERSGGSIKRETVATLAGRLTDSVLRDGQTHAHRADESTLLDWNTFVDRVRRAVLRHNEEVVVDRLGCTRVEWYRQHARAPREIDDEDEVLAGLYQPDYLRDRGRRDFHPQGVKLFQGIYYSGPGLKHLIGEKVQVRVLPHRRHRAAVFFEDKFQGWVYPKLDKEMRTLLLSDRYADEADVINAIATADAASERINLAAKRGEELSPVDAVRQVVAEGVRRPLPREAGRQAARSAGGSPSETSGTGARTPKDVVRQPRGGTDGVPLDRDKTDRGERDRARKAQAETFGDLSRGDDREEGKDR